MNDLISRKAAIKMCREPRMRNADCSDFEMEIMMLPSAQPELERTGRWIKLDMHAHLADHKCTACGQECYVPTCMGEPMYAYCPNCGARMLKEGEEYETD